MIKIPSVSDIESEKTEFREQWDVAWKELLSELNKQKEAFDSHDLIVSVSERENGIEISCSTMTVAALIFSGSGANEILFNDLVSESSLIQHCFDDVEEAIAMFKEALPDLIRTFASKKTTYQALGVM